MAHPHLSLVAAITCMKVLEWSHLPKIAYIPIAVPPLQNPSLTYFKWWHKSPLFLSKWFPRKWTSWESIQTLPVWIYSMTKENLLNEFGSFAADKEKSIADDSEAILLGSNPGLKGWHFSVSSNITSIRSESIKLSVPYSKRMCLLRFLTVQFENTW